MQTITVTRDLIQLTRLRAVNAFLVREDDGFTLVDTMIGGSADSLIAAARNEAIRLHTTKLGRSRFLSAYLGALVFFAVSLMRWAFR